MKHPLHQASFEGDRTALQTRVFSDTIILGVEVPRKPTDKVTGAAARVSFLLSACRIMQTRLFLAGLPVRGAIDLGEYVLDEKTSAGQPIINEHDLADDLAFVGCVLTPAAHDYLFRLAQNKFGGTSTFADYIDRFCTAYLVPRKTSKPARLTTVDYLLRPRHEEDIRQLVLRAFWSYGRDISEREQSKVINTEQYLRFLQETDYLMKEGREKPPGGLKSFGEVIGDTEQPTANDVVRTEQTVKAE